MAPMKAPSHRTLSEDLAQSVSLTHLAGRWGVSRKEIRQLLQEGRLPFIQIGGQLRVPADAVAQAERGGLLRSL